MAYVASIGKGEGSMPFVTRESESIPSEIRLLAVVRCLSLLDDSIPSEVKEEA